MDADWSIEIGAEAAALELPWQDEAGVLRYVDLSAAAEPAALETAVAQITEALCYPALRSFLLEVNSPPSAWHSVKCDVWQGSCDPEQNYFAADCEQGGYVDLALSSAHAALRSNFEAHWQAARDIARELDDCGEAQTIAEVVVRRCYYHPSGDMQSSEEGFSLTFFVTAYGNTPEQAAARWEVAMALAAGCWSRWHQRAKAIELG
jgi:hypothetical protein